MFRFSSVVFFQVGVMKAKIYFAIVWLKTKHAEFSTYKDGNIVSHEDKLGK